MAVSGRKKFVGAHRTLRETGPRDHSSEPVAHGACVAQQRFAFFGSDEEEEMRQKEAISQRQRIADKEGMALDTVVDQSDLQSQWLLGAFDECDVGLEAPGWPHQALLCEAIS